ncbi:MAG: hypothetical protein M3R13_00205 [Armatimonadota bacterium]|nr:hypothetical protein [Armatimonadota bacterium]
MIPHEQLDFAACVSSGQVFRFRDDGGIWSGVDGDNVIRAEPRDGGWKVSSEPDSGAWKRFLQIDVDLVRVREELVRIEPRLEPIMQAMPGLRTLRLQSAAETLFSFLCTPNNHMVRILKMVEHLAKHGDELSSGHRRFPSTSVVARLTEAALRANGFGYRAKAFPAVACELIERGEGWLETLKSIAYADARRELCSLPGVGPKLADCICLFGLHFGEAVPVDTHVYKAAVSWYFPEYEGSPLTPGRYEAARDAISARFGTLAGWAQQYLFYSQFLKYRSAVVSTV